MAKKARKLFLIFTKSLTFNTFLKPLAGELKNQYEVILCTSDVKKINSSNFQKHAFYFPVSLKGFLKLEV